MSTDNSIRLGGLTSGFDTESLIQQILSVDQARIDDLEEKVELAGAKEETWRDIAEQLQDLATHVTKLKSDGTGANTLFDDKVVTSSSESVATASATSSAITGTYNMTVSAMARANVAYGSQKAAGYTLPSGGNIVLGGTTIALTAGMSLETVAATISGASYASGSEMVATVVDDRLVIQTENTGAAATIFGTAAGSPPFVNATDDPASILETELGFIDGSGNLVNESQTSQDASFTVNGIPVTSDTNTPNDVIAGATLNLAATGSTVLTIKHNTDEIKEVLNDFIESFNETRDLISRVRTAKVNEEDEFGLMQSDALLRSLFNEVRALTTGGVRMGGDDWAGSTTAAAASISATSITINNFTAGTGTLNEGDEFVIDGDTTVYRLTADASISGNSATVQIRPPLAAATTGGESISLAVRSSEDIGIGTRTDTVSGIDGIIGVLDEDKLDSMLASNLNIVRQVFTRTGSDNGTTGIARRLFDWIDTQTKVSVSTSASRNIDDVKLEGLDDEVDRLEEQIAALERRMARREQSLIAQFTAMENAMASAQAAGSAISGLQGGGGGA